MSESTFDYQKVKQDLRHPFLSLSNHVIHELAHITQYHRSYSEMLEWTFEFRIFHLIRPIRFKDLYTYY